MEEIKEDESWNPNWIGRRDERMRTKLTNNEWSMHPSMHPSGIPLSLSLSLALSLSFLFFSMKAKEQQQCIHNQWLIRADNKGSAPGRLSNSPRPIYRWFAFWGPLLPGQRQQGHKSSSPSSSFCSSFSSSSSSSSSSSRRSRRSRRSTRRRKYSTYRNSGASSFSSSYASSFSSHWSRCWRLYRNDGATGVPHHIYGMIFFPLLLLLAVSQSIRVDCYQQSITTFWLIILSYVLCDWKTWSVVGGGGQWA